MPTILRRDSAIPDHIRNWTPRSALGLSILRALIYVPAELAAELVERISSAAIIESSLKLLVVRADGRGEDLGQVSRRVVTDVGVAAIVDAFQNLVEG